MGLLSVDKKANATDNRIAADSSEIAQGGGFVFKGGGLTKVSWPAVGVGVAVLLLVWFLFRKK